MKLNRIMMKQQQELTNLMMLALLSTCACLAQGNSQFHQNQDQKSSPSSLNRYNTPHQTSPSHSNLNPLAQVGPSRARRSHLAARRAADDSRLISRTDDEIVMGKFKAPGPERIQRQQIPTGSQSVSRTMSASFRVSNPSDSDFDTDDTRIVHGLTTQTASNRQQATAPKFGRPRKVSAKIMVSDEGLNYPPSKLSADIHGNVAEIVTAPPEAVDLDLFQPPASKLFGHRFN